MNYDRFSGSNEPDPVDESDVVYDAQGNKWTLVLDADGNLVTSFDGSDLWEFEDTSGRVTRRNRVSWNTLVGALGPLTTAPPTKETT